MKYIVFLTLLTGLCACGTSSQERTINSDDESWFRAGKTISTHTYNSKGYLDKTVETNYVYLQGLLIDSVKSRTTRTYDERNNLIHRQEISLSDPPSGKVLSEEKYKYDNRNNIIERSNIIDGHLISYSQCTYDAQNNFVRTVLVQLPMDTERRDTTILIEERDQLGNTTKVITQDSKGQHLETTFNKFKGQQKVASYTITSNGDTTFTSQVLMEGALQKEVAHYKERSFIETIWRKGNQVVKSIARSTDHSYKAKYEHVYNEKGDEIEVTWYN